MKLIYFAGRRDSSHPLMHHLHWLPIRDSIKFKICMYTYKCLHGSAPNYLHDFVSYKLLLLKDLLLGPQKIPPYFVSMWVEHVWVTNPSMWQPPHCGTTLLTPKFQKKCSSLTFIHNVNSFSFLRLDRVL